MTDSKTSPKADKLWAMIDAIGTGMLSFAGEGALSRPAACVGNAREGTLWLFTRLGKDEAARLAPETPAAVSFADPAERNFVAVCGRIALVREPSLVRTMWHEELLSWFPKGVDDPDLALVQMRLRAAEYWDTPSDEAVGGFGLIKVLGAETPAVAENERLVFEAAE